LINHSNKKQITATETIQHMPREKVIHLRALWRRSWEDNRILEGESS